MVAVGETFSSEEPIPRFLLIEFGLGFGVEWEKHHVEACVFGVADPVLVRGSLDTGGWPVPRVLAFNDVEAVIEPESHCAMSASATGSVHNHGV